MQHLMPISDGDHRLSGHRSSHEPTLYLYVFTSPGTKMAFGIWKCWQGGSLKKINFHFSSCAGGVSGRPRRWGAAVNPERVWEWLWAITYLWKRAGWDNRFPPVMSASQKLLKIKVCGKSRYSMFKCFLNIGTINR